jgi:hypothetical protein
MTILPQTINNRKILYLDIGDNLTEFKAIEFTNWVVFVIEDNYDNPILRDFAELCIDKNLLYMHATGKVCSEIDDLFDLLMIIREQEGGQLPTWMTSEDDVLMTSWDYDFDDAFWFITMAANYEEHVIDTVLVANLTKTNYFPKIQELAKKIGAK